MLEPIQSMAGVRTASPHFFRDLRQLCDERGIILIFDEVQTGVGRTGEWFFAGSQASDGVVPDIISLAKALGSGIPVGACLVTEKIASHIHENDLGTTFGGGMIAMAAVTATLEAIENDRMLDNVRKVEAYIRHQLADIDGIAGVHGLGFLLGIEFSEKAARIHEGLLKRRIITGTSSNANVLRLLPPLCLKKDETDLFILELKSVLRN
jgi:acetylornithine aminotransferase/acetylornithine/N-succinyldiaminopimelate aminotransferase